jgi:hypothetical protein
MENNEIWIKSFLLKDYYLVSNYGRIKTLNYMNTGKEKMLHFQSDKKGYQRIGLISCDSTMKTFKVHRLIFMSFHPETNPSTINHKDCDKRNNYLDNLEQMSVYDNLIHGINNGCFKDRKLNSKRVICFRSLYNAGFTRKELCNLFNVSNTTAGRIIQNKTYAFS